MLLIKDIETLKITKVKSFAVNFEIDGVSYLLHENSEAYESSCELFKKENDEFGKYELTFISGSRLSISDIMPYMRHGETYSSVNKYELVFNLYKAKLIKVCNDAIRLLEVEDDKRTKLHRKICEIEQMCR